MKIIELKGLGIVNKGAFLMIEAIKDRFKNENVILAISWNSAGITRKSAKQLGLYYVPSFRGRRSIYIQLIKYFPKFIRRKLGFIFDHEIDVILDASGFGYGDIWSSNRPLVLFENVLKNKTKSDVKIIFLPQAFGPFSKKDLISNFSPIVKRAKLIFSRDEVSFRHFKETFGHSNRFLLAPDFTNNLFVEGNETHGKNQILIIPNFKMGLVDKTKYEKFLIEIINYLFKLNLKPVFLIHEGERDYEIAMKINERLNESLDIIFPKNPLEVKAIIKVSRIAIVSRFHALVSALSQGVPVLSTSWSHKYEMLLKDYNLEQNLIDISDYNLDKVMGMISDLLDLNIKDYKNEQLKFIQREKDKTEKMWEKVFDEINRN